MRDPRVRKALRAREDTYIANLAWLDEDMNHKMEERRKDLLQEIERKITRKSYEKRTPKIWHCGHGVGDVNRTENRTPEEKKARKVWIRNTYAEGLTNNTCIIGHHPQQEQGQGKNTRKQFLEFKKSASEGDIIFNHCSCKGGITHYGIYTGAENITTSESSCPWDEGKGWLHSLISVERWIPLPAPMAGTGNVLTLYEVTPKTKAGKDRKNYKNYIISS
tara:strand:+ start:1258 stop:1917 length:660 start_codon:yes stop_codon:yes gene_type:complete